MLPPEWESTDLNDLIPVAKRFLQATLATRSRNREYKEAVKPPPNTTQSSTRAPPQQQNHELSQQQKQRQSKKATKEIMKERMERIYRSIYDESFTPKTFMHEVPPNCCVFHGTLDHTTVEYDTIKHAQSEVINILEK